MDANVTIDVGNNVTKMLEALASKIGITVEQIYPMYVKQAVISGWTTIGVVVGLVTLFSIITTILMLSGKYSKDSESKEGFFVCGTVMFAITVFVIIIGSFETAGAIKKINNPEYYATKEIISEIQRLTP